MAFGPVRHNSRHHHQHIHHVHSHQSFKNRPILARADYGSGKDHGSGVPHHNNATLPGNSGSLRGSPIWFSSGSFLSHQRFMDVVRQVLFAAGINTALYSGHSFRIGADGHSGQRDTNPWAMEKLCLPILHSSLMGVTPPGRISTGHDRHSSRSSRRQVT